MTAKKEKLLNETYKKFLQVSMYDLPLDTAKEFVDDNVMGYGTASDEKVLSLSDYLKLITRQREQASGIEMHIEEIPVYRQISDKEDTALFVDEIKITMMLDGEKHLLNLRLTSVFEYSGQKWKVIHWHGSKPDNTEGETDTWHINEWKRKNEELQKLVDEKTADLVLKNRELEIESSLERVRAVAMGMNKADDLLGICEVLFRELQKLGFSELRNSMINIHNDEKGFIVNYDFSDFAGAAIANVDYNIYHSVQTLVKQVRSSKDAFIEYVYTGQELSDWKAFRKKIGEYDDPRVENITSLYYYFYSIGIGSIGISTFGAIGNEKLELLKRFRNVFDLAYRRYIDITKAEAQAKEAQIEAALERVRARTMAMQKSDELSETAVLLFHQLRSLDLDLRGCGFNIWEKDKKACTAWMSGPEGTLSPPFNLPLTEDPLFIRYYESRQNGEDFWIHETGKEELVARYKYLQTLPGLGERLAKEQEENPEKELPPFVVDHVVNFSNGNLIFVTNKSHPEAWDIFKRFGKVFEQTYTRFLDLQKAEAQAREAQIETALERVRSRSMGMQKSEELKEVIKIVYQQLTHLKINLDHAGFVVDYTPGGDWHFWIADEQDIPSKITHPYFESVWANQFNEAKEKGEDLFATHLNFEEKNKFYNELLSYVPGLPEASKDFYLNCPGLAVSTVLLENVGLYIENFSGIPYTDEENVTLMRFGKVFQQTYTRFLDLQKAEAQAREAKIETGLERVRSRAMAMQTSEELNALSGTVFTELTKLDLALTRCVIMIYDPATNDSRWWMANSEAPEQPMNFLVQYHEQPPYAAFLKAWEERKVKWVYTLEGKIKKDWDDVLFTKTELAQLPDFVIAGMKAPERVYLNSSFFNFGNISLPSLEPLSEEHFDILLRFAKVFDLTYTRFNDLKQAEAQAREATIEAALEKVRGKAMAMHNSNDLSSTASIIFTELRKLGINPIRCGVGLLNKESRKAQLYSATSSPGGDSLSLVGWVQLSGHSVLENIYDTWLKNEEYYPELSGKQLKSYYELLLKGLSVTVPDPQSGQKQYGTFLPFSVGCLYAWSEAPYNDTEIKILKRFATIIDLTFRRYIELQKSEGSAKEAIKQSALDRIRADIASMRTTNDLEKITPLIWNELTILGIPFIRCGIFIMDDSQELIHTFLSTPEGKAIAAFHLPYATPGNIAQVLRNWQNKKDYIDHWDESAFTEFAEILVKQGGLASAEQYLKTIPHGGFYLHFLPFLQGMLYVGNSTHLTEEEIKLIQSVADAFSTAYARYEDFSKLEAAKQQVEKTLVDLKLAQTQLIQSEKMASLGELTAGIAHEIQNPLNFVNNFSEVSNELIDEMNAEIEKGDMAAAKTIANDIKQNLEKILHHGKRADGIVKGMLQHSRSSSATKEPTDINKLTDEYLRLAYHGLRAKDKTFNASMKTDYDETLKKINVIPQDIGRVILNLITNAFYVVTEKKKQNPDGYEPTVSVSTKKLNGKVEVSVKDNGNGIPPKVLDKIFQPFFTTKPTGQGTGLGLSLSYDIVKAHGGEIRVETKEGEGTEFIIQLPEL